MAKRCKRDWTHVAFRAEPQHVAALASLGQARGTNLSDTLRWLVEFAGNVGGIGPGQAGARQAK